MKFKEIEKATEAIEQQHNSKITELLTKEFQKVIDFRNANEGTTNKVKKVIDFYKKEVQPNIQKIAKNELGINIAKITNAQLPSGMFAICVECAPDDMWSWHYVQKAGSGSSSNGSITQKIAMEYLDIDIKTAKDFEKLSKGFNKNLSKSFVKKVNNFELAGHMYFDPYCAFLNKETVHFKLDRLTAKEITAIVMHEFGHYMSFIEHAADAYCKVDVAKKITDAWIQLPVKEQIESLNLNKQVFKDNKEATQIIDNLNKIKKENTWTTTLLNRLFTLLKYIQTAFVMVYVIPKIFILYVLNACLLHETYDYALPVIDIKVKNNDIYITNKQQTMIERWADQFVSRHGYSNHLMHGLDKLVATMLQLGLTPSKDLISDSVIYNLNLLIASIFNILGGGGHTNFAYEPLYQRYKSMMTDSIYALKNSNLPNELKVKYVKNVDDMLNKLDKQYAGSKILILNRKMFQFLTTFTSPVSWFNIISSANFMKDYRDLLYHIENLQNNKLYYHAEKLKQLTKRN